MHLPQPFREDPRYADNFRDDQTTATDDIEDDHTDDVADVADERHTDYAPAQSFREDPRYASNFTDEPPRHATPEDASPVAFYDDTPDDTPAVDELTQRTTNGRPIQSVDSHLDAETRYPEYAAAQSFSQDDFGAHKTAAYTDPAAFRDANFDDHFTPPRGFDPFNEASYSPPPAPWYRTSDMGVILSRGRVKRRPQPSSRPPVPLTR